MDEIGSEPHLWADDLTVPGPTERGRRWSDSIGLRVAVAVLLAGGVAAASYGIATATAGGAAVGKHSSKALATASSGSAPTKPSRWAPASGHSGSGGPGDSGPFGFGGRFVGVGTVEAVTPTTITVKSYFGGTSTFSTDSSTVYREGDKTVARSIVSVGEQIAVLPLQRSGSAGTAASLVAADVEVVQPHVVGKVIKVSGTQLVVAGQAGPFGPGGLGRVGDGGTRVTVNISTSTAYDEAGHPASIADLTAGTLVSVAGTWSSTRGQIDATRIEILPASVAGQVTAISGTTITVRSFAGKAKTLTTDSSTVFRTFKGKATIASVAKGEIVQAFGKPGPGNTFSAVTVVVGHGFPFGMSGRGPGGFFGRGFGGPPGDFGMGGRPGAGTGGSPVSGVGSGASSATL